jgi:hypothetical protein
MKRIALFVGSDGSAKQDVCPEGIPQVLASLLSRADFFHPAVRVWLDRHNSPDRTD